MESFKIRGNFSRAVRAPNIGELFTPQTVGLTNLGVDPCSGAAPVANANLRAVCLAQGAPVGSIGSITNPTAAQALATFGGNVALSPETADTWTLGAVFQPDFAPGFSISVDYYNIKITDVIGNALPGDVIAGCFANVTAASAGSAECALIDRNPITGGLDGDPSLSTGLFLATNNLGRLFTDGVDLIANYRTDVGFADLAFAFVGNWTHSSKFNANAASATSLNRECVGYYSVNCSFTGSIQPEFSTSLRTTLSFETVDLSLLWRYIDGVEFEPQQIIDDGGPAATVQPQFRTIPAEHYFDLTARWNATDNFTFAVTVQNLLNNQPKLVGNTIGSTTFNSGNTYPSTYDALGRRFAVSAKLRF